MLGVGLGRIYNTGRAVGMARWALEQAFEYVKVRETFGKKIAEYQGVTFPLAESATLAHLHVAITRRPPSCARPITCPRRIGI